MAGCFPFDKPPALAFFYIPIPEVNELWYKPVIGPRSLDHDQANDLCRRLNGIWFSYVRGFRYHAYGRVSWLRRQRFILAELGNGRETWTGVERMGMCRRLDDDDLSKIDEQVLWENPDIRTTEAQ